MISQIKNQLDIVEKVIEVKSKRTRKSDDQQSFINSILSFTPSTPTPDNKSKCSFKQHSDIIPKISRYRLFREVSIKRKKLLSNDSNKHNTLLLSSCIRRFERTNTQIGKKLG